MCQGIVFVSVKGDYIFQSKFLYSLTQLNPSHAMRLNCQFPDYFFSVCEVSGKILILQ